MRALILAAALVMVGGSALAQSSSPEDLDRLKRLLDDKLGSSQPRARALSPRLQEKQLKPDDFYAIERDRGEGPRRRPVRNEGADRRSALEGPVGHAATFSGVGAAHAADRNIVLAQSGADPSTLQVKRDSYVIQLRTDVTGEQIDALRDTLRNKYNLEITKWNSLGMLHVSPIPSTARSVAPASRSPQTLGAALEPKVITDLRKEPFVDSAYVDFVVTPKALPRRSDAKAKAESGPDVYSWNWRTGGTDDGNWGLKLIRMPPVWTILNRVRKLEPDRPHTRMTFLDAGFGAHGQLSYNAVLGAIPANPPIADCNYSHGTHVAGIAGALYGRGRGIDGMVPDAKIDAIPVGSELFAEGQNIGLGQLTQRLILFGGAIEGLNDFLDQYPPKPGERRVVNVSLGYNWSAAGFEFGRDPGQDDSIKAHILNTARSVQRLASKLTDNVLIVAAAGNDSEGAKDPDLAEWATPFAFAALHVSPTFKQSTNIIVVEATQRDGMRAAFSNAGGHVAAPGVDIMSTLAGVNDAYGMCTGTSQATPHVTALAAILFELDPKKTPAQIADIIRSSAVPGLPGTAPRIDALAAVLKLSKENLKYLVDLNGDGKVDSADLEIFKIHLAVLEESKRNGKPITIDLNGDGNVDDDERCWPLIDFNGSGRASHLENDAVPLTGQQRTDLQLLEDAWTDTAKPFKVAMKESGLEQLIAQWKAAAASTSPAGLITSATSARQGSCN